MRNTSYIEISESRLQNNLDFIRQRMVDNCTFSHVVKGNAYGHGIGSFVPLLAKNGARHFSVFDAYEAYYVHRILQDCEGHQQIMIMGMIHEEQLEWAIGHGVEFFVFELHRLKTTIEFARKMKTKAKVHIEFETGMNRSGFEKRDWPGVIKMIHKGSDALEIKGFCTHYAGAEYLGNHIRVNEQYRKFNRAVKKFNDQKIEAEQHHTACSAAFLRLPQTHMDMVRLGILQYGYWPSTETFISMMGSNKKHDDPLQRIISWKSEVMNVKRVQTGEYIGYGTTFLATHNMTVANVPVGYSHGFSRDLSNKGQALVRGQLVPVIGTINMNALMLDVTELDHIETGDEVVLIGEQGDKTISVHSFGDISNLLNYELLTRLPQDIPRFIVN